MIVPPERFLGERDRGAYLHAVKCVTIHTDGACEGNPGPGGWAAVLEYAGQRKEISGGATATTNNRMELMAAIAGLRALREHCEVLLYTDSVYVKSGISQWVAGWKRSGWKTADKAPVKNKDLWMELDALAAKHTVTWQWLKGHAGHTENERCDELARAAITGIRKLHTREQLNQFLLEFKATLTGVGPEQAAQGLLV